MKKQMKWCCLLLGLISAHVLTAAEFAMNQLKLVVDGLNIEGGTIPLKYLKSNQIWANLCVILDRPFEDGVEWQELTQFNCFPLKEASIPDYNEAQVNVAYANMMYYYIMHSHELANKGHEQTVTILLQVHRNTSGPRHLELLEHILLECYPELEGIKQIKPSMSKYELFTYFFPKLNVEVVFCYGANPENLGEMGKYQAVDVILSFSLVAGMHPVWKSGSLLIPEQFIPFSLEDVIFSPRKRYFVENH